MAGSYMFGALRRLILDLQGPQKLLWFANPSSRAEAGLLPADGALRADHHHPGIGSREAMKKRMGAPAALGLPYVRGERGK